MRLYNFRGARARLFFTFLSNTSRVNILFPNSALRPLLRPSFIFMLLLGIAAFSSAQQIRLKTPSGEFAEISSSGPQQRQGDLYIADGDVDIHFGDMRLRADHVQFNNDTSDAVARGHVQFDYDNQHLEGDEADLTVSTGRGTFRHVRGTIRLERRANPTLLITQNPLYFEAEEIRRISEDVYEVDHAWFTICTPEHPTWQFYAPSAKITLNKRVALLNANFRLYHVPLVWLPFATTPAGTRVRQSGFLVPTAGNSNSKGFVIGDAFYWAPKTWFDTTLGFEYFSRRGTAQNVQFRARPFENTSIRYSYFGVIDRGVPDANNVIQKQGGHQQQLEVQSLWKGGWRFVTDYNQLSSLTFRLAFADTYGDAINSEIRSSIFLTNNFRGFSFNVDSLNDRSFLQLNPQSSVVLRAAPEVRFSSVEQAPAHNLPVYLSFDSFAGAVHRDDDLLTTPNFVTRTEFAPKVTVPIHFGDWLGITSSATFRSTFYNDSQTSSGVLTGNSITRNTGEFAVELRPPTLERFFDRPKTRQRYKHTIEPALTYRYVTGVDDYANLIRFDSNATLTNTSEIEYGISQRLFVKNGDDQPVDFLTWKVVQKHYFDSTFGGALVPGQRNVFQALDSITGFAFASSLRNWSPIVSDLKLTPGGRYDAEQILEYDPQIQKVTTIGALFKVRPYREFFFTTAYLRLQGDPAVQPLSQQVRSMFGYGNIARKGMNVSAGLSYDLLAETLQNEFIQINYNGGCCGLAFEYRRIQLATVRTENQFRVAFILANLGNLGNLRHQEKIF